MRRPLLRGIIVGTLRTWHLFCGFVDEAGGVVLDEVIHFNGLIVVGPDKIAEGTPFGHEEFLFALIGLKGGVDSGRAMESHGDNARLFHSEDQFETVAEEHEVRLSLGNGINFNSSKRRRLHLVEGRGGVNEFAFERNQKQESFIEKVFFWFKTSGDFNHAGFFHLLFGANEIFNPRKFIHSKTLQRRSAA